MCLIRLLFYRNVDTMDLFMLPRDIRCRVLSLLLGAVKIERDQHIVRTLLPLIILFLFACRPRLYKENLSLVERTPSQPSQLIEVGV